MWSMIGSLNLIWSVIDLLNLKWPMIQTFPNFIMALLRCLLSTHDLTQDPYSGSLYPRSTQGLYSWPYTGPLLWIPLPKVYSGTLLMTLPRTPTLNPSTHGLLRDSTHDLGQDPYSGSLYPWSTHDLLRTPTLDPSTHGLLRDSTHDLLRTPTLDPSTHGILRDSTHDLLRAPTHGCIHYRFY